MVNRYLTHLGTAVLLHVLFLAGTWQISQKTITRPTTLGPLGVHSIKLQTAAGVLLPHTHRHEKVEKKLTKSPFAKKQQAKETAETVTDSASTLQSSQAPSGAGFGTGGTGSALLSVKDLFKAELTARIDQEKFYPLMSRRLGQTGRVVVTFILLEDGRITDVKLDEGSSCDLLNQAALDAVKKVGTFKPIPKELNVASLALKIPVNFTQR